MVDLIQMLGNLTHSLESVAYMVGGISYLTGILLVISGLLKLKKNVAAGGHSQEGQGVVVGYIAGGALLLFLPSTLEVVSNTAFGHYNVLQYTNYNPYSIFDSITILVRTAGLIWFTRGCIIVVQSTKPGHQAGAKGSFYVFAGMMALNFKMTVQFAGFVMMHLTNLSLTVKSIVGY